ncbi:unnamed protein product [Symbiodinium pilosum]|uniref:Uncharacterized protein n=1 Tax=Symbiodinium pilosum TaxID=2952 RepID=A0A812UN40_SYMPI|nr:unnamed protein product [Symbiodinium pilosum]
MEGLISSGEIGVVEVPHSPSMPSDDRGKDVPEPAEDPMAPVHASDAFCHEEVELHESATDFHKDLNSWVTEVSEVFHYRVFFIES